MRRSRTAVAALTGLLMLSPTIPAAAVEFPTPAVRDAEPSVPRSTDATPEPTDRLIVKLAEDATGGAASAQAPASDEDVQQSVETAVEENTDAEPGDIVAEVVSTTGDGAKVVQLGEKVEVDDLQSAIAQLEADPAVEYAEPDMIVTASAVADDPYLPSMWSLANIDATPAWDRATGAGQIIAVVDTGVISHPDINAVPGIDLVRTATTAGQSVYAGSRDGNGSDWNPRDEGDYGSAGTCGAGETKSSWHGTHVAGTAAAEANNGIGVAGVAPQAKIMPVRVLGTCGSGYASDVANGIRWASGQWVGGMAPPAERADVINLSLNFPGVCSVTWKEAIDSAHQRGSIVVSAAGNYNVDASGTSPASCMNNITVGAAGVTGQRASYSNWGWAVDLVAPGGADWYSVLSTVDQGAAGPYRAGYGGNQGTSMAAPHVAGAAAVLRELDPTLDVHQVRRILLDSAVTIGGLKHLDLQTAVKNTPRARIFKDVQPEGQFGREVHYTNRTGLLNGWSDGTFRPLQNIERGAMAAVMYREAGSPAYTAPAASQFRDVGRANPFYEEIHWAKARGYLNGWSDGTFRPADPISREATAALLYRASGAPAYTAPATSRFTDVRSGQDFYQEIHWLAAQGVTTGWPDRTFRPLSTTHRDAMSAFLYRWNWEVR